MIARKLCQTRDDDVALGHLSEVVRVELRGFLPVADDDGPALGGRLCRRVGAPEEVDLTRGAGRRRRFGRRGPALAAGADGAATLAGAWVALVPPQAATKMVAHANRPTNFRIKAPPSCVGVLDNDSLADHRAGPRPSTHKAVRIGEFCAHTSAQRPDGAALGRGSLTAGRVSNALPMSTGRRSRRVRTALGRAASRRSLAPPSTAGSGRRGSGAAGSRPRPRTLVGSRRQVCLGDSPRGRRRRSVSSRAPASSEVDAGGRGRTTSPTIAAQVSRLPTCSRHDQPLGRGVGGTTRATSAQGTGTAASSRPARRSATIVSANSAISRSHRSQRARWSRAAGVFGPRSRRSTKSIRAVRCRRQAADTITGCRAPRPRTRPRPMRPRSAGRRSGGRGGPSARGGSGS